MARVKNNNEEAIDAGELLKLLNNVQQKNVESDLSVYNLFNDFLLGLASLTKSEYAFVGVVTENDSQECVMTYFVGKEALNNVPEMYELDTLFGKIVTEAQPILLSDCTEYITSVRGNCPPLSTFLGMPLVFREKVIGIMGVVNRPIDSKRPIFLFTCM